MSNGGLHDESTIISKKFHDWFIGVLYVLSLEVWDFVRVVPFLIDRTRRHLILPDNTLSNSDTVIVFSKGWSLMNDTRSGIRSDVCVNQDSESCLGEL
jgi:hypothetical protein